MEASNCKQCNRAQRKDKTSPKHCQKLLQFITQSKSCNCNTDTPSTSANGGFSVQNLSRGVLVPTTICGKFFTILDQSAVFFTVFYRLLRDRAIKITAERHELTTEDDTISEIKTGRYWTKEERKKHIEQARERRQRQQIVILNKKNMYGSLTIGKQPSLQLHSLV